MKTFFENILEIKIFEKIIKISVIKIWIANLKTGEKVNQKIKLNITKMKNINFFWKNDIFFVSFFRKQMKIKVGKIIVIKCSNISIKFLLIQNKNQLKLLRYSSGE